MCDQACELCDHVGAGGVLLTGAGGGADAKYVLGSLGTVEWTKGRPTFSTSSSFIVVLYAFPFWKVFHVLIIRGGRHRAIEAAIEPSSHRAIAPSRLDADGA